MESTAITQKTPVLSSNISVFNLPESVRQIAQLARGTGVHYVCVSNVHTVIMGERDPVFRKVTNSATLATADGMPLLWASRVLGKSPIHGRASGPDIMKLFFSDPEFADLRHFLFGSTERVLSGLQRNLQTTKNGHNIVGTYSPPMRPVPDAELAISPEEKLECERINQSGANIVWVSLGAPKQEIWMYRMRPHLKAQVLIGVGAAFDFLSGNVKRAPEWMQKSGLEWLYRWTQQPGRLFWRYASTNPEFLVRVAVQALRRGDGNG
ncbi:MAG TPA: WecB/TagA/CpsF family glycosyltransferase [Oligoflexia bacterium]|nr:WecB/TagA/CpsF family glycosyltransferase [Oligoflexia bacterium]